MTHCVRRWIAGHFAHLQGMGEISQSDVSVGSAEAQWTQGRDRDVKIVG